MMIDRAARGAHSLDAHGAMPERPWQVLLIGGTSGVGKTSVAREVARHFDMPLSQVDGYRLMLERTTSPDAFPALHAYRSRPATHPGDAPALCTAWAEVAHEVSRALEIVVAFHAATGAPLVLEGDTLLPRLATARVLAGVPVVRQIRAVFLHEPGEARLAARLATRGRGYQLLTADARRCELLRNMAYGRWLASEAARAGCAVVEPEDGVVATAERIVSLLSR
jgi:2-phosphoglycerate kinase